MIEMFFEENPHRSSVVWQEDDKAVILFCSDKLWDFLKKVRVKEVKNLTIIDVAKIYQELKSLDLNLEKEKENAKS